jgi:hypothetical protein
MSSRIVFEALKLLMPHDVVGVGKKRFGGAWDGGYVLLDQIDPAQAVMSFGVGPSVAFDLDMAERGHDVLLFDHTIDALPEENPRFSWYREGIAGVSDPSEQLFTLAEHMQKLPEGARNPILKLDVEGAEWEALTAAGPDLLARFAQITLELHTLFQLDDPAFNAAAQAALRALAVHFVPVHVHGNNFGDIGMVGGFACVDTLEVTYARRDLFQTVASQTLYPTEYDTPNFDERPEFPLWFYPFMPGSDRCDLA